VNKHIYSYVFRVTLTLTAIKRLEETIFSFCSKVLCQRHVKSFSVEYSSRRRNRMMCHMK